MAIIDKSKKPNVIDRNDNIFIGIDLPFEKSDAGPGWFSSTSLTIDATKNNIKNLLSTEQGERLYHPNLGMGLRKYLFEPEFTDEVILNIEQEIVDTLQIWLPHVLVQDIEIGFRDTLKNTLAVNLVFAIVQDPNTLENVGIDVTKSSGEQ